MRCIKWKILSIVYCRLFPHTLSTSLPLKDYKILRVAIFHRTLPNKNDKDIFWKCDEVALERGLDTPKVEPKLLLSIN